MQIDQSITSSQVINTPKASVGLILSQKSPHSGRPKGAKNLHVNARSALSRHLKAIGVDWVPSLGSAIATNDRELLGLWIRLLPYLVISHGRSRVKRMKGKASKAAMEALAELEGRQ